MIDVISKIRQLSQDRHHCEDANGLFDLLGEIEGICHDLIPELAAGESDES